MEHVKGDGGRAYKGQIIGILRRRLVSYPTCGFYQCPIGSVSVSLVSEDPVNIGIKLPETIVNT
jgi:hypothetical protein